MTRSEFVGWLNRLLSEPLPPRDEQHTWFLRNKPYFDAMSHEELNIEEDFFHFIYHYVADVDIRRSDESYRNDQDAALRRYLLAYLERNSPRC